MRILRPKLEEFFSGLNIHICCKDEDIEFLGTENSITMSNFRLMKNKFAHVYEFLTSSETHPIEELLKECEITNYSINVPTLNLQTNKCKIISQGSYPTKNLTSNQINKLQNMAITKGYEITDNLNEANWVIGVESVDLFESAYKGIKTTLIKTGLGHNLYQKMFPNGEVLDP